MDTNDKTSGNNYFIYALGLICLLNILSSDIIKDNRTKEEIEQNEFVSDCRITNYYII